MPVIDIHPNDPMSMNLLDCNLADTRPRVSFSTDNDEFLESMRKTLVSPNEENVTQEQVASVELDPYVVEKFRLILKYHFMNPCQKYQARGRLPWKLFIQILKLILITVQLVLFTRYQFKFQQFIDGNEEAFRFLFLKDWSDDYLNPVQVIAHPYAVFTKKDFYDHVDHAVKQYFDLRANAIGTFLYGRHTFETSDNSSAVIWACKHYRKDNSNDTTYFAPDLQSICLNITAKDVDENFSFLQFTKEHSFEISWYRLHVLKFHFLLVNPHISTMKKGQQKKCVLFNISITYDNSQYSGKVPISLVDESTNHPCNRNYTEEYAFKDKNLIFIDVPIVIVCGLSFILCLRSVQRKFNILTMTNIFWRNYKKKRLTFYEKTKFLDFWYIMIIVDDVIIVFGTTLKILIAIHIEEVFSVCALFLGLGTMLAWFGMLRYLTFFHKYNILIVTMKIAMPSVLRFLACCSLIYIGFGLSGWAILCSFHYKFRSFDRTMQTMYSLVNGDDMFVTFSEMRTDVNPLIYTFSQIWLYIFIGLFIYCVLSLFIGIFAETYEHIRQATDSDAPIRTNELETFINECNAPPESTSYRNLPDGDCCCFFSKTVSIDKIKIQFDP